MICLCSVLFASQAEDSSDSYAKSNNAFPGHAGVILCLSCTHQRFLHCQEVLSMYPAQVQIWQLPVGPPVGFVSFAPAGQLSFPWPGCMLPEHSISMSDVSWYICSQFLGGLACLCKCENGNTQGIHTWLPGTSWGGKKPYFTVLNIESPLQVWPCWAPLELLNHEARLAGAGLPYRQLPRPKCPCLTSAWHWICSAGFIWRGWKQTYHSLLVSHEVQWESSGQRPETCDPPLYG